MFTVVNASQTACINYLENTTTMQHYQLWQIGCPSAQIMVA